MLRLIAAALALALLAGCSLPWLRPGPPEAVPVFRLPPSALPGGMSLQQRLTFSHGSRSDTVEALVESDDESTRVVIHAQGQVALRFTWDGTELVQTRSEWLPDTLTAERVLSDLQLVFWPLPALSAALPPGWSLSGNDGSRMLVHYDEIVAKVEAPTHDRRVLHQHRHRYTLAIDSVPVTP